jgi:hypothetical protein
MAWELRVHVIQKGGMNEKNSKNTTLQATNFTTPPAALILALTTAYQ